MIKKTARYFIELILRQFNYKLEPCNFYSWPHEDKYFKKIFEKQMKFGWNDDGPKVHRMYQTYQLSQLTHKLDGEWAEVGVFKGATAFLLASLIKDLGLSKKKNIYLFDSFKGLSKPNKLDNNIFFSQGDYFCSEQQVRNNLKKFNFIKYKNNWIPYCFENCEQLKFSLVHIDVDLHDPTVKALEFFGPRIVKNGIIIFDDYGLYNAKGTKLAIDKFYNKNKDFFIHWRLPYGQSALIKR